MKKNKLFLISSILIIICLFATAAACNLCGIPIEIGEATTEETEARQQTTEATQGQSQSTEAPQSTDAPVEGNNPPAIREIELMGMDVEFIESEGGFDEIPAVVGEEATLTIEAYDEDGDELTYVAYDSLGTSFDVTKIDNNNAEFTWLTPGVAGSYTLTIEVSDGRGGTDSYSIDMNFFDLSENNPPEIIGDIIIENPPGIDTPPGGPYMRGQIHYIVRVEAVDPDGDPLSYRWYGGGIYGYSDPAANPTEWITMDDSGTILIRVVVSDDRGGEDEAQLSGVRVE
jgi:hypothetical protein